MSASHLILPPHSVEAEQSLIGGLLLDNSAWDRIGDLVSEADFYRDDHRRIFRHVAKLIETAKPADVVTVFESIEKNGDAERCGGLAYLGDLIKNTPSAANIRRYAEIVRERATRRRLLEASDAISAMAMETGTPVQEHLNRAQQVVAEIAEAACAPVVETGLREVLGRVVGVIQERYESGGALAGLPTGLTDLDSQLGGLQRSDLIVIAGRPSMGKTALAMNIAQHAALAGNVVLIGSFEMSDEQIGMRLLSQRGKIPMQTMRTGRMADDDFQRLSAAIGALHDLPIELLEASSPTVQSLRIAARRVKRKRGALDLVVVDYLQLMSGSGDNRTNEIADISRGLKLLAKEMDIPVIALSQLSRKVEERANKRPVLSDLRDSGAIEQDADVILMLYRDEMYNRDSENAGTAEIIIGKHRNGPTGDVAVAYLAAFTSFDNLDRPYATMASGRDRGYRP